MTLELDLGAVITVGVFAILFAAIIIGATVSSVREDQARAEKDRTSLAGLVVLDPTILDAFGRDRYGERVLDHAKVQRLAATHVRRRERLDDDTELRDALNTWKEARR